MIASKFILSIDRLSEALGRGLSYLSVLMVLVMAAVVLIRYGFSSNSIALQESVTYMHGALFMLAASYTLKHDGHVRVDIFYCRFSATGKAWINCLGTLVFLLPICGFIFFSSLDFVTTSWAIKETSTESGGIPAVYLLKTLLPMMAILLALQGLAEFARNLLVLMSPSASAGAHSTLPLDSFPIDKTEC